MHKYLVKECITHKENILYVMDISTHSSSSSAKRSLIVSRFCFVFCVFFLLAPVIIHKFLSTARKLSNVLRNIDEINMRSMVMNKFDILIFPIQLNYN